MFKFSPANTKLRKLQEKLKQKVYSFDLLAGYSCPFADKCLSKAVEIDKSLRIKDGPNSWFRCYSASQEVLYSNVYRLRRSNFQEVRKLCHNPKVLAKKLSGAIPSDANCVRWHVSGDFFAKNYMRAAIRVAEMNPNIVFYGYTKAVKWWKELRQGVPPNFHITISIGGKQDNLIDRKMITSRVINNIEEQKIWQLEIDEDDSHAYYNNNDFLLLVHGIQPAGIKT